MNYGDLVYKVDRPVQSSLLSSLVLNSNIRFSSYYPALRTLSCNTFLLKFHNSLYRNIRVRLNFFVFLLTD